MVSNEDIFYIEVIANYDIKNFKMFYMERVNVFAPWRIGDERG